MAKLGFQRGPGQDLPENGPFKRTEEARKKLGSQEDARKKPGRGQEDARRGQEARKRPEGPGRGQETARKRPGRGQKRKFGKTRPGSKGGPLPKNGPRRLKMI